MMKKLLAVCSMLLPLTSSAFTVDNMILVANQDNNGVLTITSNSKEPEYVKGFINKIDIVDGEIKKVKLTKDNLPLWDLALIPNKVILNPGERRRLSMKNLCKKNCEIGKDRMYQVVLLPTTKDEEEENSVGINFGYAPVFIIPTSNPKIDYSFSFKNGKLHVNNKSNTMLYVQVDNCTENLTKNCSESYTVVSGRIKDFDVPAGVKKADSLKLRIASHDYSYNEVEYVKASN